MNQTRLLLAFIFCGMIVGQTAAQNPFVRHIYTADPSARSYNGKIYVLTSRDVDECTGSQGINGFCMPGYNMFSSTDLVNWTDHGKVVDQTDVPWGDKDKYGMWAPDWIEKNGKYYMYFPNNPESGNPWKAVGIAIADKPEGPWVVEPNYIPGVVGIDPAVFKDDNGDVYLLWGSGDGTNKLKIAKLKSNMRELDGSVTNVSMTPFPSGYKEGTYMVKENGRYYYSFAHVGLNGYEIGYAIGDSPLGPFVYKGTIMPNIANGTNHASMVKHNNQWYLFYHHWSISGDNKRRSVRAEKLYFNADGTIKSVPHTLRGIGVPKATEKIHVDSYNSSNNVSRGRMPANEQVGWYAQLNNNSWVKYDEVNFGTLAYNSVVIRHTSSNASGIIELREGSSTGTLIKSIALPSTGGVDVWQTNTFSLSYTGSGVKNLVVVLKSSNGTSVKVDWVSFATGTNTNTSVGFSTTPTLFPVSNSLSVDLDYVASVDLQLVLILNAPDGTWLGNARKNVSSGTGTETLTISLANEPAAGTGYQLGAAIRPVGGNFNSNIDYKSETIEFASIGNGGQSPFPTGAHAVPGLIEAENFDSGGQGVAYNDSDATNKGAQGRTGEGVDLENCAEGGLNIGWTVDGEWLEYTIDVASAGDYEISTRYAALNTVGTISYQIGSASTGNINLPVTGGWQVYQSAEAIVNLTAGVQVLRVKIVKSGFNLNNFTLTKVPSSGGTNLVINPGMETGDLTSWIGWGVRTVVSDAASGGHAVEVSGAGSHIQVIAVEPNTTYMLSANSKVTAGSSASLGVKEYGGAETNVVITSTNYAQESVVFTTGANTTAKIFFYVSSAGNTAYADDFAIIKVSNARTIDAQDNFVKTTPSLKVFPNPVNGGNVSIDAEGFGKDAVIVVYDMLGNLKYQGVIDNREAFSVNDFPKGVYIVKVKGVGHPVKTARIVME